MGPDYTVGPLPAGGALPGSRACLGSAPSTPHSQLEKEGGDHSGLSHVRLDCVHFLRITIYNDKCLNFKLWGFTSLSAVAWINFAT